MGIMRIKKRARGGKCTRCLRDTHYANKCLCKGQISMGKPLTTTTGIVSLLTKKISRRKVVDAGERYRGNKK